MTAQAAPVIEPLAKSHDRKLFTCGSEALDRYLKTQVGQDVKGKVAAAFMLTVPPERRVLGFYTLSATAVRVDDLPAKLSAKLPKYPLLPATLLGRLAVEVIAKGQRYGELLLMDALRRSLKAAEEIGAMAVIVDAKDGGALAFYARYGFERLPEHEHRLFLPMAMLPDLFS